MDSNNDTMCFACGRDNPISLKLDFKTDGEDKFRVTADFTPGRLHQGYDGIMHGGLITTLLDEAMAKVISFNGYKGLTAEIKVRFKESVKIGEKLKIVGILSDKRKKLILTESYLENQRGKVLASAEGKFMLVKE